MELGLASLDKHERILSVLLTHAPKALPPFSVLSRVAAKLNIRFKWNRTTGQVTDAADRWKLMLRHIRDVARGQANAKGKRRQIPYESLRKLVAMVQLIDKGDSQAPTCNRMPPTGSRNITEVSNPSSTSQRLLVRSRSCGVFARLQADDDAEELPDKPSLPTGAATPSGAASSNGCGGTGGFF